MNLSFSVHYLRIFFMYSISLICKRNCLHSVQDNKKGSKPSVRLEELRVLVQEKVKLMNLPRKSPQGASRFQKQPYSCAWSIYLCIFEPRIV